MVEIELPSGIHLDSHSPRIELRLLEVIEILRSEQELGQTTASETGAST
jgi:hypothetical protein